MNYFMNPKAKVAWFFLAAGLAAVPLLHSQENRSTLRPGKYVTTLWPTIGPNTAKDIESELKKMNELKSVKVRSSDSSVRFTVKDGSEVTVPEIRDRINKVAPGVGLTTPSPDNVVYPEKSAPPTTPSDQGPSQTLPQNY